MGLKRLSQAVVPVSPGDADPNRYVYLTPENTEPSLGLPDGNGYILYSNTDGSRTFTEIGNLLIEGDGIIVDANGRISVDPNILVNVNIAANVDVTRTGFTRFEYLTPNGQVLLTGTDLYGQDLEFSANDQVLVYVNGFLLQPNIDYTYANGFGDANVESTLEFDIPISRPNSIVSIHRYSPTLFAQGPGGNAAFSGSTDDVPEGSANLYFTNDRVIAAWTAGPGIDAANLANGIVATANVVDANTVGSLVASIDNLVVGNLIPSESGLRDLGNATHPWRDLWMTFNSVKFVPPWLAGQPAPAPVATISIDPVSNALTFTDGSGNSALTTAEVPESGNLYFTNARAIGSLTGGSGIVIEANGLIISDSATAFSGNTDSVPEGTANLYYTDERVYANVTNADVQLSNLTVNGDLDYDWTGEDILEANLITANSFTTDSFTTDSITSNTWNRLYTSNVIEGSNLYFTNARVEGFVNQNITTSNIAEGANLYFTNTRAIGSLTAGDNIIIEANGLIVSSATLGGAIPTLYTSNIVENGDVVTGNVYFTQARARAAINAGFGLTYDNNTGTVYVEDGAISTSNIVEGANLYFTNTRAVNALTAGDNIVIESNGLIISSATLSSLPTLYTSNIVEDGNTTTGNVYFSNTRARGAFTFGPGLTFNSTTGSLQANVRSVNGQTGIVVLTTSNVAEGSNLYFSNTRARQAFTASSSIDYDSGNGVFTSNIEYANNLIAAFVDSYSSNTTTTNVIEGANLYFTNARAIAAVRDNITTSNVIEGSNLYYTNNRVNIAVESFITTSNIREGSNFYFSNTRARRAFTAGPGVNAANLSQGIISIESIGGTLSGFINASNVIETGSPTTGNVFFTNARARAAFTAGPGINTANLANGIVSADVRSVAGKTGVVILYTPNVIEAGNTTTGNVYFSNVRARQAFTAGTGIDGADLANGTITVTVGGGTSNFTGANVLAGSGILVTRSAGNVTIDNTGILDVRPDPNFASNGIIVVNDSTGNIFLRLNPNVTVASSLNASTITANIVTANTYRGFFNASNIIETGSPSTGNVFFSNTRARRAFTAGSGINPTQLELGIIQTDFAQLDLTSTDTDALPEGTSNLYFTNARARAAVGGLDISLFTNDAGYLTATDPVIVDSTDIFQDMEATNNGVGHGNIAFNPVSGTISFDRVTNANVRSAFSAGTGINITDGVISLTGQAAALFDGNTDSLTEGVNNLYYSNDRVLAFLEDVGVGDLTVENITVLGEIITNNQGGDIKNVNLFSGVAVTANEWYGISTSNVVEGANLYFTNARAQAALTSGYVTSLLTDSDYIGNALVKANIRTFFDTSGDGLVYDNTTGTFSLDSNFVASVAAATSTDVQNFELANAATAGNVLIMNEDGTVDPIITVSIEGSGNVSATASTDVPILFSPVGANRQYYRNNPRTPSTTVSTGNDTDPSSYAFGHDNILVTITKFRDTSAASNADYGIVVKAVKLDQTGESIQQSGGEYYPVVVGNTGSTKKVVHIVYDQSSPELGYSRFFIFYSIGSESVNEGVNVIESIVVDPITLNITKQRSTSWKYDPTDTTWPGISTNTLGTSDTWFNIVANIDSVKQDPFNPSRFWFVSVWYHYLYSQAASWEYDHVRLGYFDVNQTGDVDNIFCQTLKDVYEANPSQTAPATTRLFHNVAFDLDPSNPNRLVLCASGIVNSGTISSASSRHSLTLLLEHLNDSNFSIQGTETSTTLNSVVDVAWHPNRNNIYILRAANSGSTLSSYTVNTNNDLVKLGDIGTSSFTTTSYDGTIMSGYATGQAKIYISPREQEKNSIIVSVGTNASAASDFSSRTSICTLNTSTGQVISDQYYIGVPNYTKFLSENPTFDQAGYSENTGMVPIGFNPYGSQPFFYTGIHGYSISVGFTESTMWLVWGALSYERTNFDDKKFVGILQESGSAGETKPVTVLGSTSYQHTALIPGEEIYVDIYDGTYANVETGSNFKVGMVLGDSNVLIYNRKLGEKNGQISITGVQNVGTGLGSLSYNEFTGTVSFTRVNSSTVTDLLTGTNPIRIADGIFSLKVGDNLTVNAGGYLTGVESFTAQDAIDAVLPEIEVVNSGTGYGSISYDSGTGTITYNKVTAADITGRISAGGGISYNSGIVAVNVGTGLQVGGDGKLNALAPSAADITTYFSADNAGTGYGSLTYNNGTGEFTYNKVTQADIVSAVNTNIRVASLGVGTAASGTAGEIRATNDITAFYSSDERLKTNIEKIDGALDKVNNIRGVKFDWNEAALEMYPDRTDRDVGVIAQEIEKVLPEVVANRDNGYKAVRYEKLVPLLIEAIKELKQEIEELKKNG